GRQPAEIDEDAAAAALLADSGVRAPAAESSAVDLGGPPAKAAPLSASDSGDSHIEVHEASSDVGLGATAPKGDEPSSVKSQSGSDSAIRTSSGEIDLNAEAGERAEPDSGITVAEEDQVEAVEEEPDAVAVEEEPEPVTAEEPTGAAAEKRGFLHRPGVPWIAGGAAGAGVGAVVTVGLLWAVGLLGGSSTAG